MPRHHRLSVIVLLLLTFSGMALTVPPSRAEEPKPAPPEAKALASALDWLKRHQDADGHWSSGGFDASCHGGLKCLGVGGEDFDIGLSALACMALLQGGEPVKPKSPLRMGLDWLVAQQGEDGAIGPKGFEKHLYDHALATHALCDAAASGQTRFKPPAKKALGYLLACQNPGKKGGGWRYRNYNDPKVPAEAESNNDTSVTACAVLALASAKKAGLTIPKESLKSALACLEGFYGDPTDPVFGYFRKPNGKLGMIHSSPFATTAMGTLCHPLLQEMLPPPEKPAAVDLAACIKTILQKRPDWQSPNLYYWHYATLALARRGGEDWQAWRLPLLKTLIDHQEPQGCAKGSWDPATDAWGESGGRIYTTALGALCLEEAIRVP